MRMEDLSRCLERQKADLWASNSDDEKETKRVMQRVNELFEVCQACHDEREFSFLAYVSECIFSLSGFEEIVLDRSQFTVVNKDILIHKYCPRIIQIKTKNRGSMIIDSLAFDIRFESDLVNARTHNIKGLLFALSEKEKYEPSRTVTLTLPDRLKNAPVKEVNRYIDRRANRDSAMAYVAQHLVYRGD